MKKFKLLNDRNTVVARHIERNFLRDAPVSRKNMVVLRAIG